MKFVCASDTHNLQDQMVIPEGDVFIHAGDFTMRGEPHEIAQFNDFLGKLPHKYKIVIAGNHDFAFERTPKEARALLTNCSYLQDSEIVVEGVRIYGAPWQPWYMDWAFNLERGAAIRAKWDLIPQGIDILVTHGPPLGHGDVIMQPSAYGERVGCADLLAAVKRLKPAYHIFGHIHEGYGVTEEEKTTYINAAMCNEFYQAGNPPIVFEFS